MPIELGQFKKNKSTIETKNKKPSVESKKEKVLKTETTPEKKKVHEKTLKKENSYQEKIIEITDQKINDVINERVLKLVKIGLKHELTIENMIRYFKETGKLKLYNLTRYFSDAKPKEIDKILSYLYKTGILSRDKNNWYSLK